MRWDRWITLGLARLLGAERPGVLRLPVLMYHRLADEATPQVHPYFQTHTHPAVFARHMAWLAQHHYQGVDLETGLAWLLGSAARSAGAAPGGEIRGQAPGPGRRLAAITFDDGYEDVWTRAWPVLRQHGFTATVFLPTDFIAAPRRCFQGHACLTWEEVRELRRQGMCFGSHTVHHPVLHAADWPGIEAELRESRTVLEERLGESVTSFAYPYAYPQRDLAFVARFTGLLQATGYTCCATTRLGRVQPGDSPFALPRLPVNSLDDGALLAAKLRGAYDWLGLAQALVKTLRRRRA